MNGFKLIVRLLAAIKAMEEHGCVDTALIDERVLLDTSDERDRLAIKMQREGLIDGLRIIEGIDGQRTPVVLWEHSTLQITIKGLQFINENTAFRKAARELKDASIQTAGTTIVAIISHFLP